MHIPVEITSIYYVFTLPSELYALIQWVLILIVYMFNLGLYMTVHYAKKADFQVTIQLFPKLSHTCLTY